MVANWLFGNGDKTVLQSAGKEKAHYMSAEMGLHECGNRSKIGRFPLITDKKPLIQQPLCCRNYMNALAFEYYTLKALDMKRLQLP